LANKLSRFVVTLAGLAGLLLVMTGCELMQSGPTADFSISPIIVYAGETFELDGSLSLSTASIVSYTWEFSDDQSLVGQQVNGSFPFPGTYSVILTVEDANGHLDRDTQQVVVYARTGTVILNEDFADGENALARWVLDPTWASANDAQIDYIQGSSGNALYIRSAASRWHRRYYAIELPPLRVGQKAVFSCRIMALRNQDFHTFLFARAGQNLVLSLVRSPTICLPMSATDRTSKSQRCWEPMSVIRSAMSLTSTAGTRTRSSSIETRSRC